MIWLSLQSLVGLAGLIGLAWLFSEDKRAVNWRLVGAALVVQIALALVLLFVPPVRAALLSLNVVVEALQAATVQATGFVFGYIGGGETPFEVTTPSANFSIAFQALPLVIVVAALAALLWHWGILKIIVRGLGWLLEKTLGIGGALGLGSAANLFMGMTEAPLFIRAYIARMSRSELFVLMTVGLATVSGTVLVLYANTLNAVQPGAIAHILTASLISLPAAILVAKVMVPGDEVTHSDLPEGEGISYASSMDAVTQGASTGLTLFLQIIAMLIAMIALVAVADQILSVLPNVAGDPLTLARLFGWIFTPVVMLFGVPWEEAAAAGSLMGTKAILNEFLAYLQLVGMGEEALSERTRLIMIYAMCGFANLGSLGMVIATLSTLVPDRRKEVVTLSLRSWVAGNLATGMTGAVVGLLPLEFLPASG